MTAQERQAGPTWREAMHRACREGVILAADGLTILYPATQPSNYLRTLVARCDQELAWRLENGYLPVEFAWLVGGIEHTREVRGDWRTRPGAPAPEQKAPTMIKTRPPDPSPPPPPAEAPRVDAPASAGPGLATRYELHSRQPRHHDRYTAFQNNVLDEVMPALDPWAWKLLSYLIRRIEGYISHREAQSDTISLKQLESGTQMSRPTVLRCLAILEEARLIIRESGSRADGGFAAPRITLTLPPQP